MKLIESAGYQHLYGIAPVLNALKADVRDFAAPRDEGEIDREDLMELQDRLSEVDGIDVDFASALEEELHGGGPADEPPTKKAIKPEASLRPQLLIQTGALDDAKRSFRSAAKNVAASEIAALAKSRGIPVAEVDKGVLNTLCGNRPHQGFVLRCGGLDFDPVRSLPRAASFATAGDDEATGPKLWLALDEVVDPQNLGEWTKYHRQSAPPSPLLTLALSRSRRTP